MTTSSAKLRKAVNNRNVLIDSNIIIYLTDAVDPYQKLARQLFQMVESGDVTAVISILSIAEVMQGPINQQQPSTASEVKGYLVNFPNCHCQEVTMEVLERVGIDGTIQWQGLRLVDSLIIACGLVNAVDLFVSNDRHFKRCIPQPMLLSFD